MNRRHLLRTLFGLGAAGLSSASIADPAVLRRNPFTLGVASGSPDHHSVVLWTRLYDQGLFGSNLPDAPIPVTWELARDERFSQILATGQALAEPALAHAVHVEPEGLPSNTWLYYRFKAGTMVSPVGRTRTLPQAGARVENWRIAFASCQHYERGYFGAYAHLVQDKPDLILFLGDYIYEYAPSRAAGVVRTVEGGWCLSLPEYRARYATYRQDPHLQAAHAAAPWMVTWDDHEVQNDYAGVQPGNRGPEVSDFLARRAAAYQAYYEHMPLRAATLVEQLTGLQRGGELRLYTNCRIGDLINLSLLDNRQYRHPQVCTANGELGSSGVERGACTALRDEGRSLLGRQQEQWLAQQHSAGSQRWHVLANATLFGQRLYGTDAKPRVSNDGWDGYPRARQRLIDHFDRLGERNLLMLGGDIHDNWIGHILRDYDQPQSARVGVEFCGGALVSSLTNANVLASRRRLNPHYVYGDHGVHGYGLVDLRSDALELRVRAVDNSALRHPAIRTAAAFRVAHGQAQLELLQA